MNTNQTQQRQQASRKPQGKPDLHIPFFERLKSVPETFGIRVNEEPEYEVLQEDGNIEVRRYKAQVRATFTSEEPDFDRFTEDAFSRLAAYIFGGNQKKHTIPMTAPVIQENSASGGWTMSFILPAKFTAHNTPMPINQEIKLKEIASYDVVALQYSGNNSLRAIRRHEAKLEKWLEKHPDIQKTGDFASAQYDAPFVIPFLKRNEVMAPIQLLH